MRHSHGLRAASGAAATSGIVTTGLVLNLDAGNATSYPGTGTTWTDLSGNGNNATLTNGPTYTSANGGAIVFDGTDDHALLNTTSVISGDFTVEVWFNQTSYTPSSFASQRCLVGGSDNSSGSDNCQFIIGDNGTILLAINGAGVTLTPTTTGLMILNNWYHIIWTRTGSNITTYLNNVSRSTGTSSGNVRVDRVGQVGANNGLSKNFPGKISSVRFYNKFLTQAEVSQNFDALRGRYGV